MTMWPPPLITLLPLLLFAAHIQGGCEFPSQWQGRWFQSGFGILHVNRSTVETKGECIESSGDKFVVYDKQEDCYRCMVIHEKHPAVLQYKETYCDQKASLQELCYAITGDAPLYSMFRKSPDIKPVPCPFKAAPFTFSYNRGSGECSNPPSRAESCTDDSRLVLKYQACPDIQSTESNVEELVCVATWKEGSTRYLVGRINQVSRRTTLSDEDQYRCFIYERVSTSTGSGSRVTYHVAQSGDATCNGLQSAVEGSRTVRLTTADTHHGRCRFPNWITDHHTWLSLDHGRTYKFSQRNATLRIMKAAAGAANAAGASGGPNTQASTDRAGHHHGNAPPKPDDVILEEDSEVRVVCHSILQSIENKKVQIVAHITRGCESGYLCMLFHKRDASVIEIQQPEGLHENTDDACRYFDPNSTPFSTLIAPNLHPVKCPHPGRYTVVGSEPTFEVRKRKKRQDAPGPSAGGPAGAPGPESEVPGAPPQQECLWHDYEALNVGCGNSGNDAMEFKASCQHQPISAYTCHGSWQENHTHFLIASPISRKSTDALRYCLIYTFDHETAPLGGPQLAQNSNQLGGGSLHAAGFAGGSGSAGGPTGGPDRGATPPAHSVMRLSGVVETCDRLVRPGKDGIWRFNFTTNGGCSRGGDTSSARPSPSGAAPYLILLTTISTFLLHLVTFRPVR